MAVWSIVNFERVSQNFILAAEQYHPAKLAVLEHLSKLPGKQIGELFLEVQEIVTPGSAVPPARLYDLTDALGNVLRLGSDLEEGKFLSNRKRARPGDILVSRLRSYLKEIVVVPSLDHDILVSPEFIVLRLRPESGLQSGDWLLAYLLSDQVQTILQWSQTGSAHPRFNTETLLSIKVPESVLSHTKELTATIQASHAKVSSATHKYAEAELLLLQELGFASFEIPKDKTSVIMSDEVFQAKRLDAEFFRPKYYELLKLLEKTRASSRLGNHLRSRVQRGTQPEYVENGEIPVIKSQHIGPRYIILDDIDSRTCKEFIESKNNKRALVQYGDVLLNSTGVNTIGRCQAMLSHIQAMVDGHVAILRPSKDLDPVFLAAFLNSPAGFLQTERAWTGSSGQIELRPDLVEDFVVWLAPKEIQLDIRNLIEESNQLRGSASDLINEAQKRAESLI